MNRSILLFVLIALFVSAGFSRAQATVTSSLTAKPNIYSGPCPTDIQFNGSIYLSNTGTLQYRFVRSDGSTNPASGKLSHYFPAAGTFKVADIWYQVNSNGSDKLEVYYNTNILLQTATAPFTVACVQPGGPSAGTGRFSVTRVRTSSAFKMAPLIIGLVPPANLHDTKDPQLCAQHLPGLSIFAGAVCASAMDAGKLILVWDWASSCPSGKTCPPADGYHVYPSRTNTQAPAAITTTNGSGNTMTSIDPKASSSGCYAVTAFKGGTESDTSVDFCVAGFTPGLPKQTITLSPDLMRSAVHWYKWRGALDICVANCHEPPIPVSQTETSQVDVGFWHLYASGASVDNSAWQGAVRFDVSGLVGKSVTSASLSFDNVTPKSMDPRQLGSCLANISLAKVDWSNWNDWIPREDYITGIQWDPHYQGIFNTGDVNYVQRHFDVNVTAAVRYWINGDRPNFGFVLVSGNEDTGANDNVYCMSRFGNFGLIVNTVGGP